MEIVIQAVAVILTLLLALVKSLRYTPVGPSDFELSRQAEAGDAKAQAEWHRRQLLPVLVTLQHVKELIIGVIVASLLISTFGTALGPLLIVLYLFAAYVIAARGWFAGIAAPLQRAFEPMLLAAAGALAPVLRPVSPKKRVAEGMVLNSPDELVHLIDADKHVLSADDKQRLKGALDFGGLTIKAVMVPREAIATVDEKETVGPVLLDRLHKDNHNMFVVVKKDLDHIKGLMYMADAVSGHPDLKTVKDAIRKTIVYLPEDEGLLTVLGASLQSGKQLFIVVDNQGNTTGLITLRDALSRLLGVAPPNQNVHLSTDPKEL